MAIQAAIFDRDGVLLTTDRRRFQTDVLARFPLPEADVARRWGAWLSGRVLTTWEDEQAAIAGFVRDLADELQLRGAARRELLQLDYRACIRGFPDAHAALAAVRRRGVPVGVLTNNSARASPWGMLEVAGLADLVDVALSAQMIGVSKPHPEAYRAMAAALHAAPEACLFFDDRPESCEAAQALGMRAYRVDRALAENDPDNRTLCDLSAVPDLVSPS